MLIHKNQKELGALMAALQGLPIEGKDLAEVVRKEWTRQQSLKAMQANVEHTSATVPSNVCTQPTTLIDDHWGLRLGLLRG